ncbi:unnamed protein product [Lactuca virosa]|uniref:Uncharacterized protein n=1 Tax=Lactuca virosa TaxID=75947 RepID=A0AAU9MHF8_9ASTR|nr:unnamed protein product [Lactuca virosa]
MDNEEVLNIRTIKSRISQKTLVDIMEKYHIDPEFHTCIPEPGNAIIDAPEGFVGYIEYSFVVPSITFFRHFYVPMSNGDWVSSSLRHGLVEICDDLPTSIKYWKDEFFFVSSTTFSGPMTFNITVGGVAEPSLDLTPEEQSTANLLSENYVKCTDADKATMGMAGMSSYWYKLRRKSIETLACREVKVFV